ncbi:uncharacterized protein LY89DRAFT_730388 [Mollisia scopiformis]|uniref:Zn(2)-C6 fungal-type domain-containing protein n=1 Tax=Mollisia scopiformis TaxID=149040 RepID=A0A194XJB5_MOLSC|nr:uncharacterized protein LY89DRAFT_730388 [Mollisia scopiformis]KUJ20340.1 hypothetical protein LY89DRAFT_730388 [Mollisia scopiformis]
MYSDRPVGRHPSLPEHLSRYPSISPQNLPTELIRRTSSDDDGRSAKRPRASKPKVKSGCITCKARRVKCDELKPACLRCQKFGRVCDGYLPEPSQSRGLIQLQPRIPSVTLYGPNTAIHTTEEESRYFQTFSEHTAYELSGYFDSAFWTRIVLQESHNVPAIRHAVVALGALTKSLETAPGPGLKVNVIQATNARHHEHAVLSHLRAIQELNQYISSEKSPQLRYALISCLLFVCFETFQGSYASSVQQTYGGLKILRSYYMGRPGSRPWIPRRTIPESSRPRGQPIAAAKILQTREGCDNISKERSIVRHVEEYLENENAPDMASGGKIATYDTEPHILMSPVYAVYDPRAKHVDIPGMRTSDFRKDEHSAQDHYSNNQSSRSRSAESPSSTQHLAKQSHRPQLTLQQASSSTVSSVVSTPTPHTPLSTGAPSPSPSSASSTQVISANRKRPLASRSPTPNPLHNDLTIEEILIQSFVRLDGQGLFFGMTPGIPPLIWDIHKVWHLPIPASFPDFPAAQQCWDFLMDRALQFYRRTLFNRAYAPAASDSPERITSQYTEYIQQLSAFDKAFKPILDQAIDAEGTVNNASALVLSLYQRCTRIILATIQSDSEMLYDAFLPEFQYITRICSRLVACQDPLQLPKNRRFSFDTGIIPPLHVVATKCRDPIVRREAIEILFSSPRQEGMWDGVLTARIGRWIAQCEEEGLPPPPIPSEKENGQQKQGSRSQEMQSSYPSPPHMAGEGWENVRRISEVVMSEYIGRGITEYGPAAEGGKLLNSAGIRGQIAPRKQSTAEDKPPERPMSKDWIVPEENRLQLMVVDFHMPDRYIRVKCQRVLLSKGGTKVERETVIAW